MSTGALANGVAVANIRRDVMDRCITPGSSCLDPVIANTRKPNRARAHTPSPLAAPFQPILKGLDY